MSTIGQTLEQQTEALKAAGAGRVFHDVMSVVRDAGRDVSGQSRIGTYFRYSGSWGNGNTDGPTGSVPQTTLRYRSTSWSGRVEQVSQDAEHV